VSFKEGFTALHYASYRGNVELAKLLLDLGADLNAKNSFGLNVLHIAAQGDQPTTLYYFHKLLGVNIL
jgi:palmitoyltransferase